MEDCYSIYILLAIIVIIFVTGKMRNKNIIKVPYKKNKVIKIKEIYKYR
jgi:hypothetical protein